jgi:hypothetical protein
LRSPAAFRKIGVVRKFFFLYKQFNKYPGVILENTPPPPPPGGEKYQPMSFGGKNMKREREKEGKCRRKRKKEKRKRKKGERK